MLKFLAGNTVSGHTKVFTDHLNLHYYQYNHINNRFRVSQKEHESVLNVFSREPVEKRLSAKCQTRMGL